MSAPVCDVSTWAAKRRRRPVRCWPAWPPVRPDRCRALADLVVTTASWWAGADSVDPRDAAVLAAQQVTTPLALALLVGGVLVQAARMMLSRKAEPLAAVAAALLRFAVVSALGLTVLHMALQAGDVLARQLLGDAANNFALYMVDALRTPVDSAFTTLLVSCAAAVLSLVQWTLMALRQAGLLVLAAMLPLAAAGPRAWLLRLLGWLLALPAAAVDGKALRGARTPEGGRVFLVAAIDHATGAVLGQRQVGDKRGEGAAARDLLTGLRARGMVWTLDALHTTKATARLITTDLHGHYILIKGNQPIARDAAAALLSGPNADWVATTATEDDRGHGRVERRTIRVAPADESLFPGAVQAFRLRRDTAGLDCVWTGKEIVYGITSLPADLAGPAQLNHYERRHWVVEDRLHWVRSPGRPTWCVMSLDPGDLPGGAVVLGGCCARGW